MKLKRKFLMMTYITAQELNKLTTENFTAKFFKNKANLATKNNIADFVKKTFFNEKLININKEVTSN